MPKLITYASYYAPIAPGTIIIEQNIYDGLNVMEFLGNPDYPIDVSVEVRPGVIVQSNDANKAAISGKGLSAGSTLTINNMGSIIGAGGRGGSRYDYVEPGPYEPELGQPGGDAIYSDVALSVASAFGHIWGGGGGMDAKVYVAAGYSPGWDASNPQLFHAGPGGAGSGPLGGGESGIGDVVDPKAASAPFTSVSSAAGRGGPGTVGLSVGGGYGAQGTWNGGITGTATGGYAINVRAGVPFTWLDDGGSYQHTYLGQYTIKGKVGTRPILEMPWRARPTKYTWLEITYDTVDFNLWDALGNPDGPLDVFCYVTPGVMMTASTVENFAFSTERMHPASTLYLKSRGAIIGRGGDGGSDPSVYDNGRVNPTHGQRGGDALRLTIRTHLALPNAAARKSGVPELIAAGGGGGGLCCILPIVGATYGGQGGAGGGQGGVGTSGTGTSMPVIDLTEIAVTVFSMTRMISIPQDYKQYTDGTSWFNMSGRGGTYGRPGTEGSSKSIEATLYEVSPGGEAGWAINTGMPVSPAQNISWSPQSYQGRFSNGDLYGAAPLGQGCSFATIQQQFAYTGWIVGVLRPTPVVAAPTQHWSVFNLADGTTNFNVHEALGEPATPVNALIHICEGVTITSTDAAVPAVSTGNLPPGSVVKLYLEGRILGRGGNGGGYDSHDPNSSPVAEGWRPNGQKGGDAMSYRRSVAFTFRAVSYVWSSEGVRRTVTPMALGGGGGGGGIVTAEYFDLSGNWYYDPATVRVGYGGAGGANGGQGGAGIYVGGTSGGTDVWATPDGKYNSQQGTGVTLELIRSGYSYSVTAVVNAGGNMGQSGQATVSTGIAGQQQKTIQGVWTQTKYFNVLCGGTAGTGGVQLSNFA